MSNKKDNTAINEKLRIRNNVLGRMDLSKLCIYDLFAGTGRIADKLYRTAKHLTLVEQDPSKADMLGQLFPEAKVVKGDNLDFLRSMEVPGDAELLFDLDNYGEVWEQLKLIFERVPQPFTVIATDGTRNWAKLANRQIQDALVLHWGGIEWPTLPAGTTSGSHKRALLEVCKILEAHYNRTITVVMHRGWGKAIDLFVLRVSGITQRRKGTFQCPLTGIRLDEVLLQKLSDLTNPRTQRAIAEEVGCSEETISRRMNETEFVGKLLSRCHGRLKNQDLVGTFGALITGAHSGNPRLIELHLKMANLLGADVNISQVTNVANTNIGLREAVKQYRAERGLAPLPD